MTRRHSSSLPLPELSSSSSSSSRPTHRQLRALSVVVLLAAWGTVTIVSDDQRNRQATAGDSVVVVVREHTDEQVNDGIRHGYNTTTTDTNVDESHNLSALERLAASFASRPPPFWPNLALERYKTFHSADVLRRELRNGRRHVNDDHHHRRRHYAVAYYWCPDRAGNVLHNFVWSLAWAIIHNRTLLVEYVEPPSLSYNARQDCHNVMQLQSWIPTVDEFDAQLLLLLMDDESTVTTIVPVPLDVDRAQYDLQHQFVVVPQIQDIQALVDSHSAAAMRNASTNSSSTRRTTLAHIHNHQPLFIQEWSTDPLRYAKYIKALPLDMRTTVGMLYKHGKDYLAGMLLRHSIVNVYEQEQRQRRLSKKRNGHKRRKRWPSQDARDNVSSRDDISIALHSRHPVIGDDGSFIQQEKFCLQQVLQRRYMPGAKCTVYIMSDRPKTLELLSALLEQSKSSNCQPVYVNTTEHATTAMRLTEHGPYAGRGYWQDWALAAQARTAVIGDPRRSSYMLVKATIMYDRVMEAYDTYGDVNTTSHIPQLIECELPNKQSKGYSYGPGTPTFTHYSLAEPLAPVKVLQDYKQLHDRKIDNDDKSQSTRKYAVVHYACPLNELGDGLERFMNDFLLAIATNRTMLWKYWDLATCQRMQGTGCEHNLQNQSACDQLLKRADWIASFNDYAADLGNEPPFVVDMGTNGWGQAEIVAFPTMTRLELRTNLFDDNGGLQVSRALSVHSPRGAVPKLYDQESDFLYGMIFHESFEIQSQVKHDAFPSDFPAGTIPDTMTIAMVSSPPAVATSDDDMLGCLASTIHSAPEQSCHVFAALSESDRNGRLVSRMAKTDCKIWIANSRAGSDGYSQSLSFFRSQLLASHARSGYIGPGHPSLALDWIEYKRRIETWKMGRDPPLLPDFFHCDSSTLMRST